MNPEPNSIYRTPECDYGDKAVQLLKKKGVKFYDHVMNKDEEVAELKNQYHVDTVPQIFLNGEHVGGYDELAKKYGEKTEEEETSYKPVAAVFSVALLLAIAASEGVMGFMGYSLSILATLKLMDLDAFANAFKNYDIISPKHPWYAKTYPFLELAAGLGFISRVADPLTGLVALFAGSVGVYSIYQAIYVHKKDLNCACIGGNSKAPLGAVSLSENLIMAIMGAWLLFS